MFEGPIERRIKRALKEKIHDLEVEFEATKIMLRVQLEDALETLKSKTKTEIDETQERLVKKITG